MAPKPRSPGGRFAPTTFVALLVGLAGCGSAGAPAAGLVRIHDSTQRKLRACCLVAKCLPFVSRWPR